MESLASTTPAEDGDVEEQVTETTDTQTEPTEPVGSEETQEEVESQVESQSENRDDTTDYDKAWDELDFEKDFDLVGNEEATVQLEDEQADLGSETPETGSKGLYIENPVLKYKGREVPVESAEELIALAQKGMKLEIEMSKIKPQKRIVKLIEDSGLTEEHIKALADAMAGKREAIDFIASNAGIELGSNENDFFGTNDEDEKKTDYKPEVESSDPVKDFWEDFSKDNPSDAAKVLDTYNDLDESFKAEIYKPDVFPLFIGSVSTGEFEQAYPLAVKFKAMNPAATWLQAYGQAVQSIGQNQVPQSNQKQEPPVETGIPKPSSSTGNRGSKDPEKIADEIWESDESIDALLEKMF